MKAYMFIILYPFASCVLANGWCDVAAMYAANGWQASKEHKLQRVYAVKDQQQRAIMLVGAVMQQHNMSKEEAYMYALSQCMKHNGEKQ